MSSDAAYQRLALKIFVELSGTIAIPALIAAVFGEWLDMRYGTEPWLLISTLVVAFFATTAVMVRKARFYAREYEKLNKS